jgi:membrane associated rhomboid family serine protease
VFPLKDNVPTERKPVLTLVLIAACVLLFGYQLTLSGERGSGQGPRAVSEREQFAVTHGAIPARLLDPGAGCTLSSTETGPRGSVECGGAAEAGVGAVETAPWLVSLAFSLFLSAGLLQLILNVLFLWLAGNTLEDDLGPLGLLLLFALGGIAGLYLQALLNPDSTLPLAGAAGGVGAVLGAYLVLHPRAGILVISMIPIVAGFVEVPVLPLVAAWVLLQLLPAISELAPAGINGEPAGLYAVGAGGLLLGLAMISALRAARGETPLPDGSG